MGMVLDILSGKRFPFLVASTMMHPPFTAAKKKALQKPRPDEKHIINSGDHGNLSPPRNGHSILKLSS